MTQRRIHVLDICCGAGGFSKGLLLSNIYKIKFGIDIDSSVKTTFERNHPGAKFITYDILNEIPNWLHNYNFDLIIGSPPCQGFSKASGIRYQLNPKNDVMIRFFHWLNILRSPIALVENVKDMLSIGKAWISLDNPSKSQNTDFMQYLSYLASEIDFDLFYTVLNSKYFGVPQKRERVFIVLVRKDVPLQPGQLLPISNKYYKPLPVVTIKDAFTGLDSPTKYNAKKRKTSGLKQQSLFESFKPSNKSTTNVTSINNSSNQISSDHPYYKLVFDSSVMRNHIARYIDKEQELFIVNRTPQGKIYRSDRHGGSNIGVWEMFSDMLTEDEQNLLYDVSKFRKRKGIKTKKGTLKGFVPYSSLKGKYSFTTIKKLATKGWLQHNQYCSLTKRGEELCLLDKNDSTNRYLQLIHNFKKDSEYDAKRGGIPIYRTKLHPKTLERLIRERLLVTKPFRYEIDLTAKRGLRGKFHRLNYDSLAPTLTTGFTEVREQVHPTENRGISLREGARLMSFPDSFTFYGTFNQISIQVGNAVAVLISYAIGRHLYKYGFNKKLNLLEIPV